VQRHLGDRLRARRLELGLRQRDLAKQWGLRTETVAGWERGQTSPSIRQWPKLVELLGPDVAGSDTDPAARLEAARRRLGLTRQEFATKVGLDEGSICRWAKGIRQPSQWMAARIEAILAELDGRNSGPSNASFFDLSRWRRTPPPGVIPTTLGEHLRARRLERGLSQATAGELFGVGRVTVHRWERGSVPIPPSRIVAVRRFVGRDAGPGLRRVARMNEKEPPEP
jgi:transcriptional regulator with XRE-family HTH domain